MNSKQIFRSILLLVFAAMVGKKVLANTYTVTTTLDDTKANTFTVGTLKWAIKQANSNPGPDVINFNIPVSGNTFENDGAGNSWAIITLNNDLPVITEAVLIDATTQSNTNQGYMPGKVVGVDGIVQANINYPDVYIVCGYRLPTSASGFSGNGLSIDAVDVTVKGLAISGFGNSSNSQPEGTGHADISVVYSSVARNANTLITQCFLSCDPRGKMPSIASRQSQGGGILILANNNYGTLRQNYVAHSGGYGIVFHATQTNTTTSASATPSANWLIEENQVIDIGTSTTYTTANGRAADGISMMTVRNTTVQKNYVEDWEQFGIDLGHNTDNNTVSNNTLTGYIKTIGSAPCGAIRTGFSSEGNTVTKNVIYNNTSAKFLGGIWADESVTSFTGASNKNNSNFTYSYNRIYSNVGSGITLSTNGTGAISGVTITQNEIYENAGLGIDLGYTDLTGPTAVTVNDNADADAGPNNLQNFPIIDKAEFNSTTNVLTIWGKAPAGSTMEFFTTDGQVNSHGGVTMSYGEGKRYLGTAVEGSASDLDAGVGGYSIDGNVAVNNANLFQVSFTVTGITVNTDALTSTATVSGSTSEFGPKIIIYQALGTELTSFSGVKQDKKNVLNWTAVTDKNLSHFEVEQSYEGQSFVKVGVVYPGSTSLSNQAFSFVHSPVGEASAYYRLRLVNKDGKCLYSKVLYFAAALNDGAVRIFPNPLKEYFNVSVDMSTAGPVKLLVVGADGKKVTTRLFNGQKGKNIFIVDQLSKLAKGTYSVLIIVNDKLAQQNIIKY